MPDHFQAPAPAGRLRCACPSDDARTCSVLRYGQAEEDHDVHDDRCECPCHQDNDEDDYSEHAA